MNFMCGIVGYIGNSQCFPILIKGLHRLEYRGYDSAGVAIIDAENQLKLCKSRGKVAELESFCQSKDVSGTIGIAHTRWATHGEPNDTNAHPHVSADGNIAIVHNGTIENYNVLKCALMKHGCEFKSETDTEVLVKLIDSCYTGDPLLALTRALALVRGSYGLAVLFKDFPDIVYAARRESPLIVGFGQGESFIAAASAAIYQCF